MNIGYIKLVAALGALATILAGCETTPTSNVYTRAYEACDNRAQICYDQCNDYTVEQGRGECQSDCSTEADQCFADVRQAQETEIRRYRYGSNYYSYSYPYCYDHSLYFGARHRYHPTRYRYSYGRDRYGRLNLGTFRNNNRVLQQRRATTNQSVIIDQRRRRGTVDNRGTVNRNQQPSVRGNNNNVRRNDGQRSENRQNRQRSENRQNRQRSENRQNRRSENRQNRQGADNNQRSDNQNRSRTQPKSRSNLRQSTPKVERRSAPARRSESRRGSTGKSNPKRSDGSKKKVSYEVENSSGSHDHDAHNHEDHNPSAKREYWKNPE